MDLTLDFSDWSMIAVFITGYFFIIAEHWTKVNKAAVAIMMAILCWIIQFNDPKFYNGDRLFILSEHLANTAQIVLFLLGALTIVEIINVHRGFSYLTRFLHFPSKKKTLWVICLVTFFLSAILDNLTTTIVMVSLLSKIVPEHEDRLVMGGGIVIAANAGGAWTPIGDVTTTMLWIGGQLSTFYIVRDLFVPSFVCMFASVFPLCFLLKGNLQETNIREPKEHRSRTILFLGIMVLIFVPIFKVLTGLPPFMAILFGLSLMWIITDLIHAEDSNRDYLRVPEIMSKVDLTSTMFFLGILLCVDALSTAGILDRLAFYLNQIFKSSAGIAYSIGLLSAVIDNVPLVAAAMGMYDLQFYPKDSDFWEMVAYCAGTGGSILIIGSAAGVAFMGMENVKFFWYLKRIGIAAFIGYTAGFLFYLFF